jgi:hypothetical protein
MTAPRDIVHQVLRFEQPEVCPYYIWVNADMVEPLAGQYGPDQFIGPPGGAATFAGSYTVLTEIRAQNLSDDGQVFVDEYGVEYRRGAALHVERPALTEPSLSGYRFPDLIEVGGNMLQPLQPEAMDVFEVKRRFGRDLCLMGGISTQQTLPMGTPRQIRDEVRRCRNRLGEGGGYVMAPAKPILPGVPLENAIALIDSFVDP